MSHPYAKMSSNPNPNPNPNLNPNPDPNPDPDPDPNPHCTRYAKMSDNAVAMSCSFCLCFFFVCTIIIKVTTISPDPNHSTRSRGWPPNPSLTPHPYS